MSEALSTEVVAAIADATGEKPETLDTALQEYIDTDALEQLAAHDTASWSLSFDLPEHTVTITRDDEIRVTARRHDAVDVGDT